MRHGVRRRARRRAHRDRRATSTSKPRARSRDDRGPRGRRRRGLRAVPRERAGAVGERERRRRPGATAPGCRRRGGRARAPRPARRRRRRRASSDRRERQVGVHDDDAGEALRRAPTRGRRRRRASSDPGSSMTRDAAARAPTRRPRARSTRRRRVATPRPRRRARPSCASARACVVVERAARAAPCPARTTATGRRRPRSSGEALGRHGAAYATGRGRPCTPWRRASSTPWLAVRAAVDDRRRATTSRRSGPVDPREQPRLVPRSADARVGRRPSRPPRALPRQGRAVRQAGARARCCAPRTRSRCSAARPTRPTRSTPRSTRCARGECVARVPRRHDLARPRADGRQVGHRAARAASRRPGHAGRAVGHAPDPVQGPQAALAVGRRRRRPWSASRSCVAPDEHVKQATDRIMAAICECVAGPARSIRSARRPATTRGGGATRRRRSRTGRIRMTTRRGHRRGLVGHRGRGDRRRQRADDAVGAPARARRRRSTTSTRTPTTCPASRCPRRCARPLDLAEACTGADVVVFGVPSHGFRAVLAEARPFIAADARRSSASSKGVEQGTLRRMTEVVAEVLAGPRPGAHRRAHRPEPRARRSRPASRPRRSSRSADAAVAEELQQLFIAPTFRVYTNPDVVGCEIAGALKNVLAIGAGIADGLGYGDNTKAALITRGLAELARLGRRARRRPADVRRASPGMGDLIATCSSPQSRNRHVGVELGQGPRARRRSSSEMNMVAEGVKTTAAVLELAAAPRRRDAARVVRRPGALRGRAPGRPRARADAAQGEARAPRHAIVRRRLNRRSPSGARRRARRTARSAARSTMRGVVHVGDSRSTGGSAPTTAGTFPPRTRRRAAAAAGHRAGRRDRGARPERRRRRSACTASPRRRAPGRSWSRSRTRRRRRSLVALVVRVARGAASRSTATCCVVDGDPLLTLPRAAAARGRPVAVDA